MLLTLGHLCRSLYHSSSQNHQSLRKVIEMSRSFLNVILKDFDGYGMDNYLTNFQATHLSNRHRRYMLYHWWRRSDHAQSILIWDGPYRSWEFLSTFLMTVCFLLVLHAACFRNGFANEGCV